MNDHPRLRLVVGGVARTVAPGTRTLIGRGSDVDFPVLDPRVSRRHLLVTFDPGVGWFLEDLSNSGTYIDGGAGERIGRLLITGACRFRLGDWSTGPVLQCFPETVPGEVVADPGDQAGRISAGARADLHGQTRAEDGRTDTPGRADRAKPTRSRTVRIGRALDNDLVVADLLVSRHHAELRRNVTGGHVLVDVGSHGGTFVDGHLVEVVLLTGGERVTVGAFSFEFDGSGLVPLDETAFPALDARSLVVTVGGGQRILDDLSFYLDRGQLLAVVGPTGAGKSTLLRALTGFRPPDAGQVLVHGHDLYRAFEELRRGLGYVPQDDILHPQLSVRRALEFGAELRFPPDVSASERARRIDEVLAELGLTERADVSIERLSGGQRKRTSVALELLTAPSVLILDEPTSGLDPGFERTVMELLRRLADAGRTVVVVTHSVASLHLCDRVLFLAPGGVGVYFGRPGLALEFFGRKEYEQVFQDLEQAGMQHRHAAPGRTSRSQSAPIPAGAARRQSVPWSRQLWTLLRRHLAIIRSDWRNWIFLGAEVLIPAVLIVAVVKPGAFNPAGGDGGSGRTLLAALVVSASAIGAANSLREIVKESPLYLRERSVGLARSAYLASKIVILGVLTTVQIAVLVLIATSRAAGPVASIGPIPAKVELIFDVSLAGLAAVAMGLAISSLVSTSEKAMALIAVVFIAEWLFSGAAIDLRHTPAVQPVAYLAGANWAFAASSATIDLVALGPAVCGEPSPQTPGVPTTVRKGSCEVRWQHRGSSFAIDIGGLLVLIVAALGVASWGLARREPLRAIRRR